MGLYGLMLDGAIDYNGRKIKVDGTTINGNTIHAGLEKMVNNATDRPLKKHDPSGWDAGADPDALETPKHKLVEYETLEEQAEAIAKNEQILATQWKPFKDTAVNVDLTGKPAVALDVIAP